MKGPALELLYVDDETLLLELIKDVLESNDQVHVDTFPNVKEAELALKSNRYDAIISDYQMPDIDGITFLKRLRTAGNDMPFVLFTGRGREEVVIEALNEGADFYLQKGPDVKDMTFELMHKVRVAVERKSSQRVLRESERTAWTLLNVGESPSLLFDREGRIIAANQFMADLMSCPPEKMVGRSALDVISPGSLERASHLVERVARTRKAITFVGESYLKHFEFTLYPVIEAEDEVKRLALVSYDTSAHMRTETELRKRLAMEELVSEVTSSLLLASTAELGDRIVDTLVSVGHAMELDALTIFNFDGEALVHRYSASMLEGKDPRTDEIREWQWPWSFARMRSGNMIGIDDVQDLPNEAWSDQEQYLSSHYSALLLVPMSVGGAFNGCLMLGMVRGTRRWSDEDQRLARVLGNIYASTLSRRRAEEELSETSRRLLEAQGGPVETGKTENLVEAALRTANRKLTLLSSITRHDILNQVSVLAGYLELTRMANRNPDLGQNLDRMEIAIKRVQESISFTKEYEQLGALGPSWQSLEKVVRNSSVGLELKGIELVSDVKGYEVFADKMLDRVFMNLIDNSMRHGDGVKHIKVCGEEEGEELTIIYEDDGAGISPDMRGKLFRRGAGKNTGFGLFLCKEILDLTRITITEIGEPGEGAKFLMKVPKGIYRYAK